MSNNLFYCYWFTEKKKAVVMQYMIFVVSKILNLNTIYLVKYKSKQYLHIRYK